MPPAAPRPKRIIQNARKQGRTILTEFESKQLLSAYGIPTVDTRIAKTEDERREAGRRNRLPDRAEALFRNHHPQDRRRRRATQPAQRRCRPPRLEGD